MCQLSLACGETSAAFQETLCDAVHDVFIGTVQDRRLRKEEARRLSRFKNPSQRAMV